MNVAHRTDDWLHARIAAWSGQSERESKIARHAWRLGTLRQRGHGERRKAAVVFSAPGAHVKHTFYAHYLLTDDEYGVGERGGEGRGLLLGGGGGEVEMPHSKVMYLY